jgi:threonine/homoserine/homoserine lactone efflux protein
MNLLNPKVSLFFWLFFPGFLFSKELSLGIQYAVLGSVFILQASIVFFVVSVAASKISSFILSSSNYMYWTNFGQAVLLICIAFYFLV